MKVAIIAALTLAGAALAGCTTTTGPGALNAPGAIQALEPGKATKLHVYRALGQPHAVIQVASTGATVWRYLHVTARTNPSGLIPYVGLVTGGKDLSINKADFVFGRDDRLERIEHQQRTQYLNQWVHLGEVLTPSRHLDSVGAEMRAYELAFDRKAARKAASWVDIVD